MSDETNLWGIHGGRHADAHSLFTKKNRIAIGWHQLGDLSALPKGWDALKARVAETFTQAKSGAIPE